MNQAPLHSQPLEYFYREIKKLTPTQFKKYSSLVKNEWLVRQLRCIPLEDLDTLLKHIIKIERAGGNEHV